MALNQLDGLTDGRALERVRIEAVVARDHLQPALGLGAVGADVRVPVERRSVVQKRRDRLVGLAPQAIPERSRIRVRIERDDSVSAMQRERVPNEEAGRRLADPALARDERDRTAAGYRRLHLRGKLAPAQFGRAGAD